MAAIRTFLGICALSVLAFLLMASAACPDGEVMCLVTAAEFGGH